MKVKKLVQTCRQVDCIAGVIVNFDGMVLCDGCELLNPEARQRVSKQDEVLLDHPPCLSDEEICQAVWC